MITNGHASSHIVATLEIAFRHNAFVNEWIIYILSKRIHCVKWRFKLASINNHAPYQKNVDGGFGVLREFKGFGRGVFLWSYYIAYPTRGGGAI